MLGHLHASAPPFKTTRGFPGGGAARMMARPVRRASRGPAPRPRRASDSMVKRGRRGALGSRAALYGAMGGAAGRGRRLRPRALGAFCGHDVASER